MNILLSTEEYEFLRALTLKRSRRARDRALQLPILDAEACLASSTPGQRIMVVPVTPSDAEWLNRITREQYGFITAAERRARLVLREKLSRALQVAESRGYPATRGAGAVSELPPDARTRPDHERRRDES